MATFMATRVMSTFTHPSVPESIMVFDGVGMASLRSYCAKARWDKAMVHEWTMDRVVAKEPNYCKVELWTRMAIANGRGTSTPRGLRIWQSRCWHAVPRRLTTAITSDL